MRTWSSKHRNRTLHRGISLVEVMVSILVVTPILVVTIEIFFNNVNGVVETWNETRGVASGQQLMNNICRMKWDEKTGALGGQILLPSTIGTDAGESADPATFDDIDDWNGYRSVDPVFRYMRVVRVSYVNVDLGTGLVTESTNPTQFKRIVVTVSLNGRSPIDITSLRSNE